MQTSTTLSPSIDVLCAGQATYDLIFSVPAHPQPDEKIFADAFAGCGGGPAANAAVAVARLGYRAAFAGYLGNDLFGDRHWQELTEAGVDTRWIVRDDEPTPLSAILVKPDGKRALINYKASTLALGADALTFPMEAKALLFDGHEPAISIELARHARSRGIPSVLDAGSVHPGSMALLDWSDHIVCSEKFARQYAGGDIDSALSSLAAIAPSVVITLGDKGLLWQRGGERGSMTAHPVKAVDSTGAGDAFHGAFAAALSAGMTWREMLRFASAAGALCCTKTGARPGLPTRLEVETFLASAGRD